MLKNSVTVTVADPRVSVRADESQLALHGTLAKKGRTATRTCSIRQRSDLDVAMEMAIYR